MSLLSRFISGAPRAACVLAASLAALSPALAQRAEDFPAAAASFLADELPRMNAAVTARDRDYFEETMGRMLGFSEQWGFKVRANPALTPYKACTDAVTDYAVVGLCRLMPAGDVCEPQLAQHFDASLRRCNELAGRR